MAVGPVLLLVNDLFFEAKLGEVLRALGVAAAVAKSEDSLRARLSEAPPPLAFVDLGAKGFDGTRAIAAIRAAAGPGARIVAFLSHLHPEEAPRARAAGADEVLAKSALVQALPDIVRACAAAP
jgi:DNA-binding NarL/FixJ family response regulator